MPSECESGTASSEFSPPSSSAGSHPQSVDSPKKDIKSNSFKCSNTTSTDQQTLNDALKRENNYSSNRTSGDSSQIAYTYCNLPYPCASPKCTKEYTLEGIEANLNLFISANFNTFSSKKFLKIFKKIPGY